MIHSLKRLTKHSAIYGVSDVLGRSISFVLVPIYTNVLSTGDYGHVTLIYVFIAFMNVFFTYGMDAAFLRFYLLEESERRQVYSTSFLTILISTVGLSAAVYLGAPFISTLISTSRTLNQYVRLAALVLCLDALMVIPFACLRGEGRAAWFAALKTMKAVIELGCNLWLVVGRHAGVEGILTSNIIGSGVVCGALLPMTLRRFGFTFSWNRLKNLLKFGLPYIPAGASVIIIELVDRFMLERMVSSEVVGVYSAAYKLGVGALLFVNVFRLAWQPFFLEASKQADAKDVYARVLTYFLLIMGGLFLGFSLFIHDLVRLRVGPYTFFGRAYWAGTGVVPLILLSYVLYGLYVNLIVGVYLEQKTTYLPLITGAAALVNIASNLVLIPLFGMYGAASSTVLAYAVMAAGLYRVTQRYYPIQYEGFRILKVCGVCGLLFVAGRLDVGDSAWLYRLGLLVCYPVLLAAVRFLNAQEIQGLKKLF